MGTVYLLHFDRPYKHAQHYLGYAHNLHSRLVSHSKGRGARLIRVIKEDGIDFSVVRKWSGDRGLERQLKNQHNSRDLCPTCSPNAGKGKGFKERYKVVRHYKNSGRKRIIKKGLTLEQAKAHCSDPETSSSTATSWRAKQRTRKIGSWFDGYDREN